MAFGSHNPHIVPYAVPCLLQKTPDAQQEEVEPPSVATAKGIVSIRVSLAGKIYMAELVFHRGCEERACFVFFSID